MMTTTKQRIEAYIKYKGIRKRVFERQCGLSDGYLSSMRKGFGPEKLHNVLAAFPDLSRDWLLYGEGDMIRHTDTGNTGNAGGGDGNVINSVGDNHITVHGPAGNTFDRALDEIAQQRRLTDKLLAKSQEQIDRLLGIVETMQQQQQSGGTGH